ncbi:hypothetical protein EON63_12175 [archaeon]|nr:MAG: hypothetical protein EON63_12175 [archaeon]
MTTNTPYTSGRIYKEKVHADMSGYISPTYSTPQSPITIPTSYGTTKRIILRRITDRLSYSQASHSI